MAEPQQSPTVIYIGGYRRSGSTLLGLLLAGARDTVHAGELSFLETEVAAEKRTACACESRLESCEFWQDVASAYRSQTGCSLTDSNAWQLKREVERRSQLVNLARAYLADSSARREYRRHVRAIFESVGSAASVSYVIDSSKCTGPVAWRPLSLSLLADLDVRLIHLVRDGRGIMWSLRKGTNRALETGTAEENGALARAWAGLLGWKVSNTITRLQTWMLENSMVVHYEELTANPRSEMERLGKWLGCDCDGILEKLDNGSEIVAGHTLGGNRLRKTTVSNITPDVEWKEKLPQLDAYLYRVVTVGGLLKY